MSQPSQPCGSYRSSGKSDLSDLKHDKKLCFIDIFVHKVLSNDHFVVSDNSDAVILDVSNKAELSKTLAAEKCFWHLKAICDVHIRQTLFCMFWIMQVLATPQLPSLNTT